ncbi:class I SAM-dependent methyltransferase [Flavobacterium amniphilum]|uniref:class I SAM-dependent methyltransferase n=1 Tax=Flavobacterium amniphilum TaxID=1834035 RepID=UPI00202A435F|nr:class I SAM-dependent methyltransferase [Flavobacterium amniphilum]MCL9805098.1 class I SAM-dependent methyltransferase [Flavobacterium amniphilum]
MSGWNYWTKRDYYHKELRDRAKGLKDEMEAAKQIASVVESKSESYDSILDVGCGTGHFILSLEKKLNSQFKYLGIDITQQHIDDANEIFSANQNYKFEVGDIRDLKLDDKTFEVSICSNTIPHIPNIKKAINELIRVSKGDVFIRMLIGDEVLITKKALSDKFNELGEPEDFMYVNIYTKDFVKECIGDVGEMFVYDDVYDAEKIMKHYNEHKEIAGANIATRIVEGMQFKGCLMLPWKIVHIKIKK